MIQIHAHFLKNNLSNVDLWLDIFMRWGKIKKANNVTVFYFNGSNEDLFISEQ